MAPQLQQLFDATEAERCEEYGSAQSQNRLCVKKLNMDMTVGAIIGTTGGKVSSAMDLEAYDLAGPSLAYANADRMGGRVESLLRLKVVCPFDDFTAELRESNWPAWGMLAATSSGRPSLDAARSCRIFLARLRETGTPVGQNLKRVGTSSWGCSTII
ncbi:MAG: hypothetical protein O2913_08885 [Chloroflexi bacterium]|nr:hypothetical protein [Chloroflexota bacterium]